MTTVLTASPSLPALLARGALLSAFKRPRPGAEFARTPLVLAGVRVDLARLAAYERVCGFPTGEDSLPVTYPHVLGFPLAMRLMSAREFPLPLLGLVHTSLAITRRTAMPATAAYDLGVRVDALLPHHRGTEAVVVTEARADGAVVWESTSRYLARHRTDGPGPDAPARAAGEREPLPQVAEWRIAGDVGRRYGAVSGDRNPIHLHPLTARPFGFPRAVAHGMWTVARCLAAHGTPRAAEVRARFRAPVPLPSTVAYTARDGRFALGGHDRLHLTGEVRPLV
ncbi:dehydratase [Streptomyces zinciresistens K42]|uniref:Dehydratase n=1 Tax=Streptomyces zinciresistens K42 TaxID=700597 RepID=G2G4D1_9ACTN|nr:MaoC/PaaZ C-terminal domain-containing protein [Streptomyces zinciresistens]EGX61606.1 dehydratase [Streptomyces zinciresistens K42]